MYAVKVFRSLDILLQLILTLTLKRGAWETSRNNRFTTREGTPSNHRLEGWNGPQLRTLIFEGEETRFPARI